MVSVMRCSSCQHIAFHVVATCPNCGHALSDGGAERGDGAFDLGIETEPLGPLSDYPLGQPSALVTPPTRRSSSTDKPSHVTLFSFAREYASASPVAHTARSRPLAISHTAP